MDGPLTWLDQTRMCAVSKCPFDWSEISARLRSKSLFGLLPNGLQAEAQCAGHSCSSEGSWRLGCTDPAPGNRRGRRARYTAFLLRNRTESPCAASAAASQSRVDELMLDIFDNDTEHLRLIAEEVLPRVVAVGSDCQGSKPATPHPAAPDSMPDNWSNASVDRADGAVHRRCTSP